MLKTDMPPDHMIQGLLKRLELMMLIALGDDQLLRENKIKPGAPPLTEFVEWQKSLEWAECARQKLGLEPSPLADPKSPNARTEARLP